jgi:hypothetical protein
MRLAVTSDDVRPRLYRAVALGAAPHEEVPGGKVDSAGTDPYRKPLHHDLPSTRHTRRDKGTPGASRGRKATGPRLLRDAAPD